MSKTKTRIMIVEDDTIVAKDLEESLISFGYEITTSVDTGEEAIKEAEKERPDLVLMDIRLRGKMDGIEAAEIIRKNTFLPVIYLTAYSDEKTLQRAKITEPFGYVLKPFDEKMLHTVIEMALYRHNIETKLRSLKEYNENILESMPVGVTVLGLDKRITSINRTEESLFGIAKEEAIGKIMYSEYLKGLKDRMELPMNKTLRKGESIQELNVGYTDDAGGEYVLDIFISPLIENATIKGAVIATRDATDKMRLKNKLRVLERKEVFQLTENDRLVLYSLVKYPELNNIELAKKMKMKRTTFIGIRNKLRRKGFYAKLMIPDLQALGYRLINIEYGNYANSSGPQEALMRDDARYAQHVEMILTESEYYSMIVTKDIGEYREIISPLEQMDAKQNASKDLSSINYSLNTTQIKRLFDYSCVLENWFSIPHHEKKNDTKKARRTDRKLSGNELKVLYAIAKYPEGSEKKISEKTQLSVVTVNQIKRRLIAEGLIKTAIIPNLKKIGCGLMLLMNVRFSPLDKPLEREKELTELLCPSTYIADAREAFLLIPYRNYPEYKTAYDNYLKAQSESRSQTEDIRTMLIQTAKIKYWKQDYAPLIKKIVQDF